VLTLCFPTCGKLQASPLHRRALLLQCSAALTLVLPGACFGTTLSRGVAFEHARVGSAFLRWAALGVSSVCLGLEHSGCAPWLRRGLRIHRCRILRFVLRDLWARAMIDDMGRVSLATKKVSCSLPRDVEMQPRSFQASRSPTKWGLNECPVVSLYELRNAEFQLELSTPVARQVNKPIYW